MNVKTKEYFPLTLSVVDAIVPQKEGIYVLAVQLNDGSFESLHISFSDNLNNSFGEHILEDYSRLPENAARMLKKYKAYGTFFLTGGSEYKHQFEKLFTQTVDPISSLTHIVCN
jgi:hypothetical protein